MRKWLLSVWPVSLLAAVAGPELLPLKHDLPGAGCRYTLKEDPAEAAVLVVEARSRDAPLAGSARIRVGAEDQALTPTDPDHPTRLQGGGWEVEVVDLVDQGKPCTGDECEGTFQQGRLHLRGPAGTASFEVVAHCGA